MNILRIIASVDPRSGGPVEGVRLSATAMAAMGHSTEVATLDRASDDYVASFPVPVHPQESWSRRYGYTPNLSRWIVDNADRFDAAVVHGLWNHASIGGWQGLRKAGLPYVVFTHGMMDPWFKQAYPVKHLAKQAFWTLWQGKVLRDASAVLFTSDEERRLARGVFSGHGYRETVVAYGASEPPPETGAQHDAFRKLVPALGQRHYFLFLSRIHEKKGCDLLVSAFARVAAAHPEIDLVVAGPDQVGLQSQLEDQAWAAGISGRIHWPGMMTGDAKWGAFRGADAFILPSHSENFGIVVAEAMACGTPVLITDKVNIWREVEMSGGGFVEADTLEGTVRLLERWLALSGEEKTKMAAKAQEGFAANFHVDAAARDLIASLSKASQGGSV